MYVFTNISIFYSGIMGRLIVISDGTLLMVLVFYIPIHSNHAMIAYLMLHMGQKYSRHCSIFDMGWRLLSNIAQSSIKITKIQRVFSIFSSRLKKEHNLSAKAVWQTRRYQLYSTTEFSFFFLADQAMAIRHPTAVCRLFALWALPPFFLQYVAENLNQRVCSFTKS